MRTRMGSSTMPGATETKTSLSGRATAPPVGGDDGFGYRQLLAAGRFFCATAPDLKPYGREEDQR